LTTRSLPITIPPMNAGNSNQHTSLVFVSYAREDNKPHGNKKGWLDRLLPFLKRPLKQAGIELFIDNTIISGEYSPKIKTALERATAALLLISPSFMDSDYIIEHELPVIISRYKAGLLDIFPVLISHCTWDIVRIPYPGQEQDNLPDGFLLSHLILPEHDPKQPLDGLPESDVNKVFKAVTRRILEYHKKWKQKVLCPYNKKGKDTKNIVKQYMEKKDTNKKSIARKYFVSKNTALVPQRPSWASVFGKDQYGSWAEFSINGVTQRMRWIKPGEFLMGSPEDEPGRSDDEYRHQIIITRGFWLADTACTQRLWRKIMGTNPSYYKAMNNPVESINWDIVCDFIKQCNHLLPSISLRLPTEAEWEYACRAGTTTPFHFGQTITTEQANYNGNNPYPGGTIGEYRKKTVEVKAFSCNAWGLFQMHGNVLEWCADWYDGEYYKNSSVKDPQGPKTGRYNVLRGGCWGLDAKVLRSSCRYYCTQDDTRRMVGFRLAAD
jgi:formylglycine-generating enzyme